MSSQHWINYILITLVVVEFNLYKTGELNSFFFPSTGAEMCVYARLSERLLLDDPSCHPAMVSLDPNILDDGVG